MTIALVEALRKVARAQIAVAPSFASTLGQDAAREIDLANNELLAALDQEPVEEKASGIFGERVFKTKKKKKTA